MLELQHISFDADAAQNSGEAKEILRDVSLKIDERFVAVTGPNGSGKSTLARIISGILKPTSGRILLDGEDITDLSITEKARRGISFAFQQPVRFKGLTVRDLLEIAAGHELNEDELCDLLGRVGLCADEYIGRELDSGLSGGEMKRVEIASVLARRAPLCIFDEPEAGIDLWSFARLVETFQDLRASRQSTLLVISHQERILSIADEIVVIADGRVRQAGPASLILPMLLADESTPRCPLGKERASV